MHRTRAFPLLLIGLLTLGPIGFADAQPSSRSPGGYGPIRLGMDEAAGRAALASVAHDIVLVRTTRLFGPDDPNALKFAVAVPWEDSYVGALDAETQVQVGIGDGRVVTVFFRRTIKADDTRCRRAYTNTRERLAREFGPFQEHDANVNPESEGMKSRFQGWLYVSRYAPASSG